MICNEVRMRGSATIKVTGIVTIVTMVVMVAVVIMVTLDYKTTAQTWGRLRDAFKNVLAEFVR